MRTEIHVVRGPVTLDDDLILMGVLQGACTVPDGRELHLMGVVSGDLVVEEGGRATVMGVVNGCVVANGAVRVIGMVHGTAQGSGLTIESGAHVGGHPQD